MINDTLNKLGLTKTESAAYLALIDLGSATTGPIIKKARIASGKAYLSLNSLVEKGLVTYVTKEGKKYYKAKNPEILLNLLKDKEDEITTTEKELKDSLPMLKSKYEEKKYELSNEIYEGTEGFKRLMDFALEELKKGEIFYAMGASREANERFEGFFIDWHTRREEQGVKMKMLYNHNCRDFGEKRTQFRLMEIKYLKKELETPSWMFIFGEYTAIISFHSGPACFQIKDNSTAYTYKKYFENMWKRADK